VFRIYYNRREDYPNIWSFDSGSQDTEQIVTGYQGEVDIAGCGFNSEARKGIEPAAWIWIDANSATLNEDGSVTFH
jgi:hypothetical protein